MRVCLYSPYLTNLHRGGGEKHFFDIAAALPEECDITIAVSTLGSPAEMDMQPYRDLARSFANAQADAWHFSTTPLGTTAPFWKKLWWTRQFDQLFYATDGSAFFSLAKQNHLHVQIPFTHSMHGLINRLKLRQWRINTNSNFTKQAIEENWPASVEAVINPLVEVDSFEPTAKKAPMILHVGRFFQHLHAKRQDVLIDAFKQLRATHQKQFADWELHLVGAIEDREYVADLKSRTADLPIVFHHDISREQLIELYEKAAFYWHATGYDVDPVKYPEKVEHFGISVIEAMAAGAVPVVINKGGMVETVGSAFPYLLWNTLDECVELTHDLVSDPDRMLELRTALPEHARIYDVEHFTKHVRKLFGV